MITATQFTFKNQRAYLTAIEAADIFNREQPLAPKKVRPVPFNASALIRDLVAEEAEQSANKILKPFINASTRNELFTMHPRNVNFSFGDVTYDYVINEAFVYEGFSYNFTNDEAAKIREAAFEVLCAFEFNKLSVSYQRKFVAMMRNPNSAPMVYKRYARALRDYQHEDGDWKLLAFILSSNAEEHYDFNATYPRTTETAFIKHLRANAFGVKLTASDELHAENAERVAQENLYLVERVLAEAEFADTHAEALDEDEEFENADDSETSLDTDIDFEPEDE